MKLKTLLFAAALAWGSHATIVVGQTKPASPPEKKAATAKTPTKTTKPTHVCTDPIECNAYVTADFVDGQCSVIAFPADLGFKKGNKNVLARLNLANSKDWEFMPDEVKFKQPNTVFEKLQDSPKQVVWRNANAGPGEYPYQIKVKRKTDGKVCPLDPSYINDQ
jgi:hypothetical protein